MTPSSLTIRKPRADEREVIVAVQCSDPRPEYVAPYGSVRALTRVTRAQLSTVNRPEHWRRSVVAEVEGAVVGVMMVASRGAPAVRTPRPAVVARWLRMFARLAIILGPIGCVRAISFMRYQRLWAKPPTGADYIFQIDVAAAHRNQGIGARLLEYAEESSRHAGARAIALHTVTSNPALRLYERMGYVVIETRRDPRFERRTRASGVHLLVKDLARDSA